MEWLIIIILVLVIISMSKGNKKQPMSSKPKAPINYFDKQKTISILEGMERGTIVGNEFKLVNTKMHPSLKSDKEVMLRASQLHGALFQDADESLKADKEFVIEVVSHNGYAVEYASDNLKADKSIAMAVAKSGSGFGFLSDSLRADKEVVLAAYKSNRTEALAFVHESLKEWLNQLDSGT